MLERLRFLTISASNLDEFYMVRVAGLYGMVKEGVVTPSADGLSPNEQLSRINETAGKLFSDQQDVWVRLRTELRKAGISVIDPEELSLADKEWLDVQFREQIFPVLTPLAIDPAHPFPFIPNLGFTLALKLVRRTDGKALMALLPVPAQLQRFIRLPGEGKEVRFLPLEKLIVLNLDKLFPGHSVAGSGQFRLIRDSDVEVEEEAEDLVLLFESMLKQRRRGSVIHMICSLSMPEDLRLFIADHLSLSLDEFVFVDHMLGLSDLKTLILKERTDLQFKPYVARFPERIRDHGGDCFAAIRVKDISSTIHSKVSTWWCSSCARRRPIPKWWRSSRRCTAPATTPRS